MRTTSALIRKIPTTDIKTLVEAAALISKYSWGEHYPINPLDEVIKSESCIGAYSNNKLIGFASVTRFTSPDGKDTDAIWLAHAVVAPNYRGQGVFRKLYTAQLRSAQQRSKRILTCTDNVLMKKFLLTQGWKIVRTTTDESGQPCKIFVYQNQ